MFRKKCNLTEAEINARVESLLQKMSLKEKVFLLSGNWNMVKDIVVNKRAYNPVPMPTHGNKRLGIVPIGFTDGPRGVVMGHSTCFPVSMARAASFDTELERRVGDVIGKEARAGGANLFAGVCINLLMHPAGGRAQESYGEDPFLVGEMGSALVRGVQYHNVMACVKHYAVNNMENKRFEVDVDCSERTLREVYLPHFKKCFDAGAAAVMGSYNLFRGDQASESKYLLTDVLRNDWGFEGFALTDFIYALRNSAKAIKAGMDVEMPVPVHFGKELIAHVEKGDVSEAEIDTAARRVLRTQLTFQHTDDPMKYDKSLIACKEHTALSQEVAEKSMVLIKNKNQVLPLSRNCKRILVAGKLADQENTGDHGSSTVYASYVVTALQGIRKYLGEDVQVDYCGEDELEKAKELARNADAVIIVAGNDFNDEGEYVIPDSEGGDILGHMGRAYLNNGNTILGKLLTAASKKGGDKMSSYTSDDATPVGGDRKSLSLKDGEIRLIRELGALNKNTVVTLVCGSMIMTKEWDDAVSSILYSFYAGMEGGHALARVLFGDVNPSGKLPFTIPADEKHLPEVDFNTTKIYYDYHHGYRKLDKEGNKPAYPFGYGLSYTSYTYSDAKVMLLDSNTAQVSVNVKNTGDRDGTEAVQVYVRFPNSSVERHVKELKGFTKAVIAAGEEKVMTITVAAEELKYFDETAGKFVLEDTDYEFLVGPSSDEDTLLNAGTIRF